MDAITRSPGAPHPNAEQDFTGIDNFRDYGGYRAAAGTLRARTLFRSAQHCDATRADLVRLAAIDLCAVADLRGEMERRDAPCRRHAGFSANVLYVEAETATLGPHVLAGANAGNVAAARRAMVAGYREMPRHPPLQAALRLYFRMLAEHPGPTLVHCMVGKDRTGIAVALLHHLLGVPEPDMMEDYLRTNDARFVEAKLAGFARSMRALHGHAVTEETVRVLMCVEPDYLRAAFGAMEADAGSVSAYLETVLEVTPARRAAIAAHLIV